MGLIGDIAGGVGSLAGAAFSYFGAKEQRKYEADQAAIQRAWNEQMMDKKQQMDIDMMEKYGTEKAKVQQKLDAGMNPLWDGSDSAAPVASASALPYQRPSGSLNPMQSAAPYISQAALTAAQVANVKADTRSKETDADLKAAQAETENILRDGRVNLLGTQIEVNKADAEKVAAEVVRIRKETEKADAEIAELYNRVDVEKRKIALEEASFKFEKYIRERLADIEDRKLDQHDKEIELQRLRLQVDWYNATTNRLMTDSNISMNESKKVYMSLEGNNLTATNEYIKAQTIAVETNTENAKKSGKYIEAQAITGMVTDTIEAIADCFTSALKVGKSSMKNPNKKK